MYSLVCLRFLYIFFDALECYDIVYSWFLLVAVVSSVFYIIFLLLLLVAVYMLMTNKMMPHYFHSSVHPTFTVIQKMYENGVEV